MIKTIDHHITISLSWLSSYSLARGARLSSQPAGRYTCCHETLDYCNTLLQEAASRYWIRFSVSWTVQHQWYSVERVVTTWHHCSETVYIYTGFTSVNEWRSHYVCSSISHFTDWDQATSLACLFHFRVSGPEPLCGLQHAETLRFHELDYKLESRLFLLLALLRGTTCRHMS